MQLLIASTNPGKIREFREILAGDELRFTDLSAWPPLPVAEETGRTFRANACQKASFYARHTHQWTLADDSGLSVVALGGKPGVHSARWAERHHAGRGDAANNALILKQLDGIPENGRMASFCCVLSLADPKGRIILTAMDSIEGQILLSPRGTHGFGYDPLFLIPSLGQTTAELAPAVKHQISHRGRALRRLRTLMSRVLPTG